MISGEEATTASTAFGVDKIVFGTLRTLFSFAQIIRNFHNR